jgi:hypothetical protein
MSSKTLHPERVDRALNLLLERHSPASIVLQLMAEFKLKKRMAADYLSRAKAERYELLKENRHLHINNALQNFNKIRLKALQEGKLQIALNAEVEFCRLLSLYDKEEGTSEPVTINLIKDDGSK